MLFGPDGSELLLLGIALWCMGKGEMPTPILTTPTPRRSHSALMYVDMAREHLTFRSRLAASADQA